MDTFYVEIERFWDLFDQTDLVRQPPDIDDKLSFGKRMKRDDRKPRVLAETEACSRFDKRYVIMWGPHKPGKKNKVWEGDGFLTMIGRMAHVSDLKGRMLEEPTILDDIDYQTVEDMGDLMIGNTEIQIIEVDKKK